MHILFVDESGTPPKPDKHDRAYFVIAGLIIDEENWVSVRKNFVGLKAQFQHRGEVKWRFFAPNNNDPENPMLNWPLEKKQEFREKIFKVINKQDSCKIIACVSEAPTAYNLKTIQNQEDLYFNTYKPLTERFQYFLQDAGKDLNKKTYGIIVADHRGRNDDEKMRQRHERLVREGNNYSSNYANFIESLFFSPSHMSIGIQLADMVAGAIWRAQTYSDHTWLEHIKPAFRKGPNGEIDGYGICRFPKKTWTGIILS